MPAAHRASAPTEPRPGLRERKKIKTREAIRDAAHRLFAERGYGDTSVERIAEAADVSPSTVLRYFPAKEDIVLGDAYAGYGAALAAALEARPADEPPPAALGNAVRDVLAAEPAGGADRAERCRRLRLVLREPALRARMAEDTTALTLALTRVLAARTGRPDDDVELRVWVGAVLAGVTEALLYWAERGAGPGPGGLRRVDPAGEPGPWVDRALEVLARGPGRAAPPGRE